MSGFASRIADRRVCAGALSRNVGAVTATAYFAPAANTALAAGSFVPFSAFLTRSPDDRAFDIVTTTGPPDAKHVRVRLGGQYLITYNIPFIADPPMYCLALYVNGQPYATKGSTISSAQSVSVSESLTLDLEENALVGVRVLEEPITITGGVIADPQVYSNTPTITLVRLR